MLTTSLSVLALLATAANAAPAAISNAGVSTSDVFPPTGTQVNTALFPDESVVGYQQPTPTGVEPFLAQTGVAYPSHTAIYPLVVPQPSSTGAVKSNKPFNIAKYWGNLTPQFSVDSSFYGLAGASPSIPAQCEIVQFHTLFRHGARYPTTGAAPSTWAAKVQNATKTEEGFTASGPLEFLNEWEYQLGAELLTPFGRLQNFQWGVAARQLYGKLLNNFTETGTLPVFRTQSQDRMNFAAGFFGVPEYVDQVSITLGVEAKGLNTSGAPYETCPNSNNARGSVGSTASTAFVKPFYEKTAARLSQYVSGNLTIEETDINALLQLCSYETDALGESEYCKLFTEEEFQVYEQAYDLSFSGKVSIMDAMTALNLKALAPLVPTDKLSTHHQYIASQIVPFGTILQIQVLECQPSVPTKQIRFILNDAVLPIHDSYEGCNEDFNGLCAYDTVVAGLKKRLSEIDVDYACNGNYSVPVYGDIVDGLPPKA
ncbi:hypothetical protein JCM8097_001350 [Rhodosporidiobolus ruineniae]